MAARQNRISQGSCWTCRKRRVKCDTVKPCCGFCRDSSQDCSYNSSAPVKWVGGPAKRGRLAIGPAQTQKKSDFQILTSPPAQQLDNNGLLLYFANVILPRFQLSSCPVELHLPDVLQDQALQQAIGAVAQAHYALNSKSSSGTSSLARKQARHSAIHEFRKRLELGLGCDSSVRQLVTANILLCILDGMIEPSEELNASIYHLKGGFALIEKSTSAPVSMLLQGGLEAHLLSVFTTIDLVYALLSGDKPFFESMYWFMFAQTQTWWGSLEPDDPFLHILKAFSDMACLGHLVFSNPPSPDLYSLIDKCLPPIKSVFIPTLQHPATLSAEVSSSWTTFCSIYKICGLIYSERALRQKSMDDEAVQAATRQGVEKLIDVNLSSMMRHCTIFPMLVIGCHCMLAQDRRAIMEVLAASSSYLSFGSLLLMERFLQNTWSEEDPHKSWWSCFEPVAYKTFLF